MSLRRHPQNANPGLALSHSMEGVPSSDAPPTAPQGINPSPGAGSTALYRERLVVPVTYWLLAIPAAVTLGAEAYFFVDGFIPPLVIGVLFALIATLLVHWSSATIEVTGDVLRAGEDTLALSDADEVIALDERQAMALRGPQADPAAHILLRPYLKRAVFVRLADKADAVPYWLVATRHPEKLAAAIGNARPPGGSQRDSHQSGDWESVG